MRPGSVTNFIIEQRSISQSVFIRPGEDDPVRAVDVLGRFAAIFRLAVSEDGGWYDDCAIALKTGDGWRELSNGGSHGNHWLKPWRPAAEGWDGRPLAIFGSAGGEMPEDEDSDDFVLVLGHYGFTTDLVKAIRITDGSSTTRTVDVTSPAGAFVVITTGTGDVELQGLDTHRRAIGPPTVTHIRPPKP